MKKKLKISNFTKTAKEKDVGGLFRELPYQAAVPKDLVEEITLLIQKKQEKNTSLIIKLIDEYIINEKNSHRCIKMLKHIIEQTKSIEFIQMIYYRSAFEVYGPLTVDVLRLLLDHGLPIDDYLNPNICSTTFNMVKGHTPLHYSIIMKQFDCVR